MEKFIEELFNLIFEMRKDGSFYWADRIEKTIKENLK